MSDPNQFPVRSSDEMTAHIDAVLSEVRQDVGLFGPGMDELSPEEVNEILTRDNLPMGRVTQRNIDEGWPFVSDGYHHDIPGGYGR